jgi:hypothetical protein
MPPFPPYLIQRQANAFSGFHPGRFTDDYLAPMFPNEVEQATRRQVEAQSAFNESKDKLIKAKKELGEAEKELRILARKLEDANDLLLMAKSRDGWS